MSYQLYGSEVKLILANILNAQTWNTVELRHEDFRAHVLLVNLGKCKDKLYVNHDCFRVVIIDSMGSARNITPLVHALFQGSIDETAPIYLEAQYPESSFKTVMKDCGFTFTVDPYIQTV